MKISFSTISRIAISFIAIGLIVYFLHDKIESAFSILLTQVEWRWFAIALILYVAANLLQAIRLLIILKVHQIHMTVKESFYLNFVGLFFNLFLPSAVGGDIVKAYYAYKHSGKKIESTSAVIQDRLTGFLALMTLAVIALAIYSRELNDAHVERIIFLFLGIFLFLFLFVSSKRFARKFKFLAHLIPSLHWRQRLHDLYHALYDYKKHKLILFGSIGLSFVIQSAFILVHYFTALSLGANISIWIFFLLVPVIAIASMAPSLGGLGVREAGVIFFFSRFMSSDRALALSLLLDLLIYGFSFLAGLIFAIRGGLKSKVIHEIEELGQETEETQTVLGD